MLCRTVPTEKILVKLEEYKYSKNLKELVNQSLEDSEHLSPAARKMLPSVR